MQGRQRATRDCAFARLSKLHSTNAGEFAVVVTDQWQRKGLGTEMTNRLNRFHNP